MTMRGNEFERNIVESESAEVPVVSLLRVPFSHNTLDSNLYWAPGENSALDFKAQETMKDLIY
jgi:hypothetical protein